MNPNCDTETLRRGDAGTRPSVPDGYRRMSIREQLPMLERLGLSALEARMAVAPRLWARSRQELEDAWKLPPGMLRDRRVSESCGFWQGFWSTLRTHLEAGDHQPAQELLERAIARTEPWTDGKQPQMNADKRRSEEKKPAAALCGICRAAATHEVRQGPQDFWRPRCELCSRDNGGYPEVREMIKPAQPAKGEEARP